MYVLAFKPLFLLFQFEIQPRRSNHLFGKAKGKTKYALVIYFSIFYYCETKIRKYLLLLS